MSESQPPLADALVQHGGVHHQKGGYGAAVRLLLVRLPEFVQPEVLV